MTSERTQTMFISATHRRQPCSVDPFRVRKQVERMEQAGWELVSREPADDTVPAMEVMLMFRKGEA